MPQNFTDCMIDFETMGPTPDSVVLQMGWCFFNRKDNEKPVGFRRMFCQLEQKMLGRTVTPSTADWWETQDQDLFQRVSSGKDEIEDVLSDFTASWQKHAIESTWLWSNGPAFDEPILVSLYNSIEQQTPWKFWNSRCLRTLKATSPFVAGFRASEAHDALNDALAQAKTVRAIYQKLDELKRETN
ncbi:3'-5' exonuclease [Litorimonas haliclonae]|uniref:3'-5' exonuclease n=1 Tax=Litorimonas haliclonae TaxID=2081977 RepID=UPI0039F07EB0